MDANGLRFWLLADKGHWQGLAVASGVDYDTERRSLRLRSSRSILPLPATAPAGGAAAVQPRLDRVPHARDAYGTLAYWDAAQRQVLATGATRDTVPIYDAPADEDVTDLVMGDDGVLYLAVGGRVVLVDRRGRWANVTVSAPGFTAWRLAADPAGGVWALDRDHRSLGRVYGLPFPDRVLRLYGPNTFRPCPENPNPPRLLVGSALEDEYGPLALPVDETCVALATGPDGQLAVLTWLADDRGRVRVWTPGRGPSQPLTFTLSAFLPYSLAWVAQDQVAVLLSDLPTEAPVFPVGDSAAVVEAGGDFYPLRDHDGGPFSHTLGLPPFYSTPGRDNVPQAEPLYHISLPEFARIGEAENGIRLDSGSTQTIWHRLYLEAAIPPECGIRVYLAATNEPEATVAAEDWHEHQFGLLFAGGQVPSVPPSTDPAYPVPRGAWVASPSELPFHPGLLRCPPQRDQAGLFTALVQRANRRVRALRGRYLRVRVELLGNGRASPEVAAVRVYGSRFSYLDRYLPELYHESVFGPEAEEVLTGPDLSSTRADFLGRFLNTFESFLTPIEDRIAQAYLLTDPRTTPDEALEWLGSWIGVAFEPGVPPRQRRRLIQNAPRLYRQRGTLAGLRLALDVATDDACERGQIIVLEDFRLRRTFATILGADLADETDPLLAGLAVSGNSIVGDTLFLGDEHRQEFLALFSSDLPKTPAEEEAIQAFFDNLAYRVTVLVHQAVEPQHLDLIQRIVDLETPAHSLARVLTASEAFMVGIASLVGVDSFLADKPAPQPVRVDQSALGVRDFVLRPASLDPRLEGGLDALGATA